jgi:hypothetical protein
VERERQRKDRSINPAIGHTNDSPQTDRRLRGTVAARIPRQRVQRRRRSGRVSLVSLVSSASFVSAVEKGIKWIR